nr:uncharacterized protein LOC106616392 [Bactrocera oleae]
MRESFIFILLVVIVVVIYAWILYIGLKPAVANFKENQKNGQINYNTNEPIQYETIKENLDKYDEIPCTPCGIKVNGDLTNNSPILTPHNKLAYLRPNSSGEIVVPHGEWVKMRCGDAFSKPYTGQTLDAQCAGGKDFRINGEIVNFEHINCTTMSMPTPMRTGSPCKGGTEWLDFGIKFGDSLLPTMRTCFDRLRQTTPYAIHTIDPASMNFKHGVKSKNTSSGDFFDDKNVDMFFERKRQIKTLTRIVGRVASTYITDKNYLSRGHVVAKADCVFSGQQKGTYHYVNMAPQWQSFNNGNWSCIEDGVRKFAHDHNTTLLCCTGTWCICTLPDVNNVQQEIYLKYDEQNDTRKVPVPKFFFRIVIDESTRRGIALVGVNNPYLTIEEVENGGYVIAEDVSHNINWINWERKNIEKGYCYACSVPNFVAIVKDLPLDMLETTGILGLEELPI